MKTQIFSVKKKKENETCVFPDVYLVFGQVGLLVFRHLHTIRMPFSEVSQEGLYVAMEYVI